MLYIEYSGTEFNTSLANEFKSMLEHHTDKDVELMIGEPIGPIDGITLLNNEFDRIIELTSLPDPATLKYLYL